jgi:hypothetical protein
LGTLISLGSFGSLESLGKPLNSDGRKEKIRRKVRIPYRGIWRRL